MRKLLGILLFCSALSAQPHPFRSDDAWKELFGGVFEQAVVRIPGPGAPQSSGAPVFGTPSTVVSNHSTGGTNTVTKTTTAGDMLYLWGTSSPSGNCTNYNLGSGVQLPTATGGETFVAIPFSGAIIAGTQVTAGGTGYGTAPTCSISGAGSATCTATLSGPSVIAVGITNQGSLSSATQATITLTPVSGGSGATAVVSSYCGTDAAGGVHMGWYAKNIPGTSSEVFTADNQISGFSFNTIGVAEVSGASTSAPFDTASFGVNTSGAVSPTAFNTANPNEIVFCSARVENDPSTWTAGSSYSLISGAPSGGTGSFSSVQYSNPPYTSTQTGLTPSITSGATGDKSILCAAFTH